MSAKLSDKRPAFFMVEDAVFQCDLTPYQGWVYMAILKHANRQTGIAFPGVSLIAKLCNMSRAQVMRCIRELEKKSIIRVERDTMPMKGEKRQRKPNHYVVLSIASSIPQSLGVVSTSDYPSIYQRLPLVSTSDLNQSKETKVKEQEVPAAYRAFQSQFTPYPALIESWRKAYKDGGMQILPQPTQANIESAVQNSTDGITADMVYDFTVQRIKDGKPPRYEWVITDLPAWLLNRPKPKPELLPEGEYPPPDPYEWKKLYEPKQS